MTIDINSPTYNDSINLRELELYHLIMAYRAEAGLAPVPLSKALSLTTGRHAVDWVANIWGTGLRDSWPDNASLHSWSFADGLHLRGDPTPAWMYTLPQRFGTGYSDNVYEISVSAAGTLSGATMLASWKGSPGHNAVIVNSGIWAPFEWGAIGIGIDTGAGFGHNNTVAHVMFGVAADASGPPDIVGSPQADTIEGTAFGDRIFGGNGNDVIRGHGGNDTIYGGDGADTLNGGDGDDFLYGGSSENDLRDVIYGGAGNDYIDGGYGNDELYGGAGNDTIDGGFGADTIFGNEGDDILSGGPLSDLIFGGAGNDFINGGFGHDRLNGGPGADTFFHLGIFDHGSDWVQDYSAAEGDVLMFGLPGATHGQFQVNIATTPGAGAANVAEAFVIYRPTGQIIWALVDGAGQSSINLMIGGQVVDLLA